MAILTTITSGVTNALSSDDGTSMEPNYRDGCEVRKIQGIEGHSYGKEHDDSCPPEKDAILWCMGSEIGCNDGHYDSENFGGNK